MSRVGKQPIPILKGAEVKVEGGFFTAKGPKGEVTEPVFPECPIEIKDGEVRVGRTSNAGSVRAKHGLARALLANAVNGVVNGFTKNLEIVGVGYRGEVKGHEAHFSLGYSHPVIFKIPEGITMEIDKANRISIAGADRQKVGQAAAEIRSLRPPDPYKGKGIRYSDERIRRKVGKTGAR